MPTILKKFVSQEAISEVAILKMSRQPGRVYVTSVRPTRNWQKGEKPETDMVSFTRSEKSISPSNYPLRNLQCYHFGS